MKHDVLIGRASDYMVLGNYPRVPGRRGWLDGAENLTRIITGIPEPGYSRAYWHIRGLLGPYRRALLCRAIGHKPTAHERYGRYCERCSEDL